MKKPVVDYRDFRLSRLNDPRFSHLKLLGGWIVYFVLYFLTENFIPAAKCHTVHCALDDLIPFCEVFVIPYVFWYALIVFSLLYFWKSFVVMAVILICLSTMFIKQHSAVDFFAALPVCLLAELLVYGKRYIKREETV